MIAITLPPIAVRAGDKLTFPVYCCGEYRAATGQVRSLPTPGSVEVNYECPVPQKSEVAPVYQSHYPEGGIVRGVVHTPVDNLYLDKAGAPLNVGDRVTPAHRPGSREGVITGFNSKNRKTPILVEFTPGVPQKFGPRALLKIAGSGGIAEQIEILDEEIRAGDRVRGQAIDFIERGLLELQAAENPNALPTESLTKDSVSTSRADEIEAQIQAIRASGAVAPKNCWIEPETVYKHLANGDRKRFNYKRLKAYEPIFEGKGGKRTRVLHLGAENSAAYSDWVERMERRRQINQLEAELNQLLSDGSP